MTQGPEPGRFLGVLRSSWEGDSEDELFIGSTPCCMVRNSESASGRFRLVWGTRSLAE